ncbi:MAG: DNA ligase [Desulfobacteraceae bacterium]|jgi:DNA ligase (NAD+)
METSDTMKKVQTLVAELEKYNAAYRAGEPLVSDVIYDDLVVQLAELAPEHPFLQAVEPEVFDGKKQVRHPVPMLSTEKAYTSEQLARFCQRVAKEAAALKITEPFYRVTPKLDGLAGRDDGNVFATRGNGEVGYDVSNAFDKGIIPVGGRGQGIGEIVAVRSYFEEHLAEFFVHPRNMVVGIISSDVLNENAQKALEDGMVHFVPYSELPDWQGTGEELLNQIDTIKKGLLDQIDYPHDGLVAEVTSEEIKKHMGATSHHYRWQIAIKEKGETAVTTVEDVLWQVGRTGNVTPVLQVEPVLLSGATIRRVTAHHAGMVRNLSIGRKAVIEIIRSGEVIPKLEVVHQPAQIVILPSVCPVCQGELTWSNDFLKCENRRCPAQIEQRISHWFKTLGTADWFGIKTIQKLVAGGYDSLEKIYAMDENAFKNLGFGPVQSANLAQALHISRNRSVEDWRFLAAFGIADLGKGDSRKILGHIPLEKLPETKAEEIEVINGFGEKTSRSIQSGLADITDTFHHMLALQFNLTQTPLIRQNVQINSPIANKKVVFSGKMEKGSRDEMQAMARSLGAVIQSAVSGTTDFLICGAKVGAGKLSKAEKLGVTILSEKKYLELIGS